MRRIKRHNKKVKKNYKYIWIILILLIFGFGALFFSRKTYWNNRDKFIYISKNSDGGALITVLDPSLGEITSISVPAETEVDVARQYGTLRLKNVWQLGVDEGLGAKLMAETLTKDFLFPVYLWMGEDTNIPLTDRLYATMFEKRVKNLDRTEIDLAKSQYLKKVKLEDGENGYRAEGVMSERITFYFSDNYFSNKNLRFNLIDSSGISGTSERVGRILEVMGGKVVAVDKKTADPNLDCELLGKDKEAVLKVSRLFSCQKVSIPTEFDLEMRIGGSFAKRF